ncbi:MAG: hypothetical protein L3J46_00660 [Kangiellaceae bacterium]|nr:hypothetical protein [Kangiellaceae bacterium]
MFNNRKIIAGLLLIIMSSNLYADDSSLPDPYHAGWKGKPVCERLFEDKHKRILRCSFPPSVGHERHYHISHFGYAISGGQVRITDQTGTREVKLPTGSSFSSDGVVWHNILNIGNTTIVYLIVEDKIKKTISES